MKKHKIKPQFVVCINNKDYPASLEPKKIYQKLPDSKAAEYQQIRVIDESGEDYLYPIDNFVEIELPKPLENALLIAA